MTTKLSPVKQKMKDALSLNPDEYILIAGGSSKDKVSFYQNFLPNNPKASRVETVVACIQHWIKQYGRGRTFAGINTWLTALSSKKINPKLLSDKGKLKTAYIEAIIKNTRDEFVATSTLNGVVKCGFCGRAMLDGRCTTCD